MVFIAGSLYSVCSQCPAQDNALRVDYCDICKILVECVVGPSLQYELKDY